MNTYYHGSAVSGLSEILPYAKTGVIQERGRKKNLDVVFFTTSRKSAMIYAQRAVNIYGGVPIVYEVEPIGEVVCLNGNPGTEVFFAPLAKVVSH